MRVLWPTTTAGLDLGSHSIKTAVIRIGPGGAKTLKTVQATIDSEEPDRALAEAALVARRAEVVSVGIGGERAFYRRLDLPRLSGEKLRKAALYELEDRLPVPVDGLRVDLLPQPSPSHSGQTVWAFAVDRAAVEAALASLDSAGAAVQVVSLDVLGLIGAAQAAGVEDGVVLDIGAAKTTIACFAEGRPIDLGHTDLAGDELDRRFARLRDCSLEEGRAFKEALAEADETEAACGSFLTDLAADVGRVVRAAYAFHPDGPERLYLSGGTARLAGIDSILGRKLNLSAEPLRPLDEPTAPEFTAAVGLALAGTGFNLGRDLASHPSTGRLIKLTAAALAAAVILAGANIYRELEQRREALKAVKAAQVKLIRDNLPHLRRVVSPLKQMELELAKAVQEQAALERGRAKGQVLEALLTLNKLVEDGGVTLSEVVFDGPRLTLAGKADSFDELEEFQVKLSAEKSLGRVKLDSSRMAAGGGVKFKLRISR